MLQLVYADAFRGQVKTLSLLRRLKSNACIYLYLFVIFFYLPQRRSSFPNAVLAGTVILLIRTAHKMPREITARPFARKAVCFK